MRMQDVNLQTYHRPSQLAFPERSIPHPTDQYHRTVLAIYPVNVLERIRHKEIAHKPGRQPICTTSQRPRDKYKRGLRREPQVGLQRWRYTVAGRHRVLSLGRPPSKWRGVEDWDERGTREKRTT